MKTNFIMKPKVDFCFKELMEDPIVRKGFVASVLHINPLEIKETKLLPTALRREHSENKLGILDVRVLLNQKEQLDIEMQIAPFDLWPERSLFYLSKMFSSQIKKGEEYDRLCKCIHIGILDFELFPENTSYYSCFHFWEDDRREKYSDKMEIHILELPKIRKQNYPETELLEWLQFMNAEKEGEFKMLADKNEYLSRAYDRLSEISADEQKQLEYEARLKAIRDHNYLMKYNLEKGRKEGIKALIETCRDLGISREMTMHQLKERLLLNNEEVENYMNQFWQ